MQFNGTGFNETIKYNGTIQWMTIVYCITTEPKIIDTIINHVGAYNFFLYKLFLLVLIQSECRFVFATRWMKVFFRWLHIIITMLAVLLMSEILIFWKHRTSKASVSNNKISGRQRNGCWWMKLDVIYVWCVLRNVNL